MANRYGLKNVEQARHVVRHCFLIRDEEDKKAAEEMAQEMFDRAERGENACFLHVWSERYGHECECGQCKPNSNARKGMFA